MSNTEQTNFLQKLVHEDNCLVWSGYKNKKGYGVFSLQGKTYLAHRVAYYIYNNSINNSLLVLHRPDICNNPSCCKKEHLYQGNCKQNSLDMVSIGKQHIQKLNLKQAKEIRDKYIKGATQEELAIEYCVHKGNISKIVLNNRFVDENYKYKPFRRKTGSIWFDEQRKKYIVHFKHKNIGRFNTLEEAEQILNGIIKNEA
jgi:hypothetical protein